MAHENKVLRSINLDGDRVCVDVFVRPDGTFGFDEFRRDAEDSQGWFSIGYHGHHVFQSEAEAFDTACETISWLTLSKN